MTNVAKTSEVLEGRLTKVRCDGKKHLLTRVGDEFVAVEDRCPHLGWSMARGTVKEGVLTCPWHGSRYDVCSGKNLDWVNSFAGVPMPGWSHRLIALGRSPTAATVRTLRVEGDDLVLDAD